MSYACPNCLGPLKVFDQRWWDCKDCETCWTREEVEEHESINAHLARHEQTELEALDDDAVVIVHFDAVTFCNLCSQTIYVRGS